MDFISCRDSSVAPRVYSFEEAISIGWAEDGGMILPKAIPILTSTQLNEWKTKTYSELCVEILSLFIKDL